MAFVAIVAGLAVSKESTDIARINGSSLMDTVASVSFRPTVDQVVESSIVADLAEVAGLPVASNVANMSASLAIKHEILQTDDVSNINKPKIIDDGSLAGGLTTYTVAAGDSVESIAKKHNISEQTLRWANNMKTDANVEEGTEIILPAVDGVVYTVKEGDTIESLADKYKANAERITIFNNLELDGLTVDQRIVIPSGELPETERPGYVAPAPVLPPPTYWGGGGSLNYSNRGLPNPFPNRNNGYAYGWCTWYVAEKRFYAGRPIAPNWGNAFTWASSAGFTWNHTPSVGGILQRGNHVMYIESIGVDGTVFYSEMNGPSGWNRVDYGSMSAATAATYMIIP
jgi:LysM repeat protein